MLPATPSKTSKNSEINNLAYLFYYIERNRKKILELLRKENNAPEILIKNLRNLIIQKLVNGEITSQQLRSNSKLLQIIQSLASSEEIKHCINPENSESTRAKDPRFNTKILEIKRQELKSIFEADDMLSAAQDTDIDSQMRLLRLFERRTGIEQGSPLRSKASDFQDAWSVASSAKNIEAGELELLGFNRQEIAQAMGTSIRTLTNNLLAFRSNFSLPSDRTNGNQKKLDRARLKFFNQIRQDKFKGLSRSYLLRDRLFNFLFNKDELFGEKSILSKYKLSRKELFKILINLIKVLKAGVYKDSIKSIWLHINGHNEFTIAKLLGIQGHAKRDIESGSKVLKEYLFEYLSNPPPKWLVSHKDKAKWMTLKPSLREVFKRLVRGESNSNIAQALNLKDGEIHSLMYQLRKFFNWSIEDLKEIRKTNIAKLFEIADSLPINKSSQRQAKAIFNLEYLPNFQQLDLIFCCARKMNSINGGQYIYPHLKGLSSNEISKYYGISHSEIKDLIEQGLIELKDQITDLMSIFNRANFLDIDKLSNLSKKMRIALLGHLLKLSNEQIRAANPNLFRSKVSVIESQNIAIKRLGFNLKTLRKELEKYSNKPFAITTAKWASYSDQQKTVAIELFTNGRLEANRIYQDHRNLFSNLAEVQKILNEFLRA